MFEFWETLNLQKGIVPGEMGCKEVHSIFMLLHLPYLTGKCQDIFHTVTHRKND